MNKFISARAVPLPRSRVQPPLIRGVSGGVGQGLNVT